MNHLFSLSEFCLQSMLWGRMLCSFLGPPMDSPVLQGPLTLSQWQLLRLPPQMSQLPAGPQHGFEWAGTGRELMRRAWKH